MPLAATSFLGGGYIKTAPASGFRHSELMLQRQRFECVNGTVKGWLVIRFDPPRARAPEAMLAGRRQEVMDLLEPEAVAPILVRLDEEMRDEYLHAAPAVRAAELRRFLAYPESSAASLMDRRAPVFRGDAPADAVAQTLRAATRRDHQVILVTDADGRLTGTLPVAAVLLADPHAPLDTLGVTATPAVAALAPREEVADVIDTHRLHVNLIPYNPIGAGVSGTVYRRPAPERVDAFLGILRDRGVVAHVRATRGDDVDAACGQLRERAAVL